MTKKLLSFAAAPLTIAFLSVAAISQTGPATPSGEQVRGPKAHRFGQIFRSKQLREKLGLTNQQAEKLRDMRLESARAAEPTRASLRTSRLELRQLISAEKPDQAAINRKVSEISEARSALMKIRINQQLAAREILTLEQRQKLAELRSEFRSRRMERRMEKLHAPRPGGQGRPSSSAGDRTY